jgi:hypothetical protein
VQGNSHGYSSPNIIDRIEAILATDEPASAVDLEKPLVVNQVLVNEYRAGQGISVSRMCNQGFKADMTAA